MKLIFDVGLDCDIDLSELPELPENSKPNSIIKIRRGTEKTDWIDEITWQKHWLTEDGDTSLSMAKYEGGYVLGFPELVDFVITFPNPSIQYYSDTTIPTETIRHLLLDHVIPRILGQQGRLILHASAIMLSGENKALAFIGNSGWGKSTIASSFLDDGARLLTDDCLLLDINDGKITCIPNYFGLRLFDDSMNSMLNIKQQSIKVAHYSDKKRLLIEHGYDYEPLTQIELSGFFLLGDPAKNIEPKQIIIKPITGVDDLMKLIGQIFIIDVSEHNVYQKLFKNIGQILSLEVPLFNLDYPRNYTMLSSVKNCVIEITQ